MAAAYLPQCSVESSPLPARTAPFLGRPPKVLPTHFEDLTVILIERITAMNSHTKTRAWRESPFWSHLDPRARASGSSGFGHASLS